jgi:hypothetical protein
MTANDRTASEEIFWLRKVEEMDELVRRVKGSKLLRLMLDSPCDISSHGQWAKFHHHLM